MGQDESRPKTRNKAISGKVADNKSPKEVTLPDKDTVFVYMTEFLSAAPNEGIHPELRKLFSNAAIQQELQQALREAFSEHVNSIIAVGEGVTQADVIKKRLNLVRPVLQKQNLLGVILNAAMHAEIQYEFSYLFLPDIINSTARDHKAAEVKAAPPKQQTPVLVPQSPVAPLSQEREGEPDTLVLPMSNDPQLEGYVEGEGVAAPAMPSRGPAPPPIMLGTGPAPVMPVTPARVMSPPAGPAPAMPAPQILVMPSVALPPVQVVAPPAITVVAPTPPAPPQLCITYFNDGSITHAQAEFVAQEMQNQLAKNDKACSIKVMALDELINFPKEKIGAAVVLAGLSPTISAVTANKIEEKLTQLYASLPRERCQLVLTRPVSTPGARPTLSLAGTYSENFTDPNPKKYQLLICTTQVNPVSSVPGNHPQITSLANEIGEYFLIRSAQSVGIENTTLIPPPVAAAALQPQQPKMPMFFSGSASVATATPAAVPAAVTPVSKKPQAQIGVMYFGDIDSKQADAITDEIKQALPEFSFDAPFLWTENDPRARTTENLRQGYQYALVLVGLPKHGCGRGVDSKTVEEKISRLYGTLPSRSASPSASMVLVKEIATEYSKPTVILEGTFTSSYKGPNPNKHAILIPPSGFRTKKENLTTIQSIANEIKTNLTLEPPRTKPQFT